MWTNHPHGRTLSDPIQARMRIRPWCLMEIMENANWNRTNGVAGKEHLLSLFVTFCLSCQIIRISSAMCCSTSTQGAALHCLSMDQLIADLDTSKIFPWSLANADQCPHCPSQAPNCLTLLLKCTFGGQCINFSGSWTQKLSHHGCPWFSHLNIAKVVTNGPVKLWGSNPNYACFSFY